VSRGERGTPGAGARIPRSARPRAQFEPFVAGGAWPVFEIVAQICPNIEVVVSSRLGDHKLWIDVLEQGAYDVLVEPYEREEVRRIVETAADKSYMRSLAPAGAMSYKTRVARAAGAA
jgi:DNA-binding NtrC family response regulator